ncbi:DUF6894 family protein [Bradyrhizobium sp. AZCC 1721]|uniref:DUF6894 family protein n=1 Tax=Bradyrhizobium sp. AZCC 1721 TaxID=3117016 RepID=UPI002FF28F0C
MQSRIRVAGQGATTATNGKDEKVSVIQGLILRATGTPRHPRGLVLFRRVLVRVNNFRFSSSTFGAEAVPTPRYHFDLREGDDLAPDDEGLELLGSERVQEEAARSLADMARDAIRKNDAGAGHQMGNRSP